MAAIRFPLGGGRYRGTPQRKPRERSQNTMFKSMAKAVFMFVATILLMTMFSTIFLALGWNYGIVPAIQGTNVIHLRAAGWLALCLSTFASYFKFSIKVS
jgi:hypothetical protein